MFQRQRAKKELIQLALFIAFSLLFLCWILGESGGILFYPQWKNVDGHLYYTPVARSLFPLLPLLILGIDAAVLLLTLWGLQRQVYLSTFSVCLGTLLLFSITVQAFFSDYGKHLLTLLAGLVTLLVTLWFSRLRPTLHHLSQRVTLDHLIAILILLLALAAPLLGQEVNGSRAWIYFGSLSLQPGQLLMPLLAWYAAARFPCRNQKEVLPFFVLSVLSILSLVIVRDLGNAAILVVLMLIACWYLTDRTVLCVGLAACCVTFLVILIRTWPNNLSGRFNLFHAFDQVGTQQYQALYALLRIGLHGSGVGQEADYLTSTTVTFAQNDLAALLPLGIFGLGAMILLLLAFSGLLLDPAHNPAASPYHVILHSGAVSLLFAQGLLNLGGAMNVLPFTGVCFPVLSTGGSSMVSTFALLGFCLSSLVWGSAGVAAPQHRPFSLPSSLPFRRYSR